MKLTFPSLGITQCFARYRGDYCRGRMKPGIAMGQTVVCDPRKRGDIVTMWHGGPGRIIPALKCERCGHSVTT